MTSINTNAAATVALRTLQETSKSLESTQKQISTGLKISEAKDNAAYWSIATTLKSDNKSLSTVKDALGLGAATVDTAYQGLNKAKEVLDEIKSKLTAATQDGVDRSKIQTEISELQKQLVSIASSSTFSGENWLSVDSNLGGYNANKSVVSGSSRDAAGAVTISTINVDTSAVKLFDANAASKGIVDTSTTLKKADGTVLTVGGMNATGAAPTLQGLDTAVATVGTAVANASAAVANVGTLNLAGLDKTDKITFNLAVDGAAAQTVTFTLGSVTGAANFTSGLQAAINNAVGTGKVAVAVDGVTNAITLTSQTVGSSSSVAVLGLAAVDGNGTTTSNLGLVATAVPAYGTGGVATTGVGTFAAANVTNSIADGDKITYKLEYDGDMYQGTYTFAAGQYTTAATPTADEFAAALTASFATATKISDGTTLGAGKALIKNTAGALTVETVGTGTSKSVSLIQTTAVEGTGGTAIAATKLGLTDAAATAVGTGGVATYSLGTYAIAGTDVGDRIRLDLTVASDATGSVVANRQTVNISTAGLGSGTLATDRSQFIINAQAAINSAFGAGKVTVSLNGTAIELKTTRSGVNESLTVHNIQAVDGDGAATSTLGLANASLVNGNPSTTLAAAKAVSGAGFTGPATFDAQDALTFNVAVDGGAATKVTVDKATIDAALGGTAGTITTAANFATVVNKALQNASLSTALTATVDGSNKLVLTKATAGAGSVAISTVASTTGGDTISVATIDVSDGALASLGVDNTTRKDVFAAYISAVNTAINKVTTAASTLGSVSKRIDLQKSFVNTLMDSIDQGVSGLVDADISEESTKLQALQVKQQLGVQALSIANQSSQQILRLFQ